MTNVHQDLQEEFNNSFDGKWLGAHPHEVDMLNQYAYVALESANKNNWAEALRWAKRACEYEITSSPYGKACIWGEFYSKLQKASQICGYNPKRFKR